MRYTQLAVVVLCLAVISQQPAAAADRVDGKAGEASAPGVAAVPLSDVRAASRQVDKLIEAGYAKHGVKPMPLTSDELFLAHLPRRDRADSLVRRGGRIPGIRRQAQAEQADRPAVG